MADPISPCRDITSNQFNPDSNDTQYEVTQESNFYGFNPNCGSGEGLKNDDTCNPTVTMMGELPAGVVVEDVASAPQFETINGKRYQFIEICGEAGKNTDQFVLIEADRLKSITASIK